MSQNVSEIFFPSQGNLLIIPILNSCQISILTSYLAPFLLFVPASCDSRLAGKMIILDIHIPQKFLVLNWNSTVFQFRRYEIYLYNIIGNSVYKLYL